MIKRFLRLYPLHLFFLLVFSFIELTKYFLAINYDLVFNKEPFLLNDFSNFFLHLFFLQHYADKYSFNGPAWSISVEMFLYFSFAILFFVNKKFFLVIPTIFAIVFFLFLNDSYGAGYSHGAFFSGFYSFSLGCIFCKIYLKNKKLFESRLYNIIYFILLIIFFAELFGFKILFKLNYAFIYSIFFGLVIYLSCFLNKNFFMYKLFFNNWFIYLGKISYSIYLGHVFVFYFLNNFLKFIIYPLINTSDFNNVLKLSVFEAHIFTIVAYSLTIILAALTYRYIETKFYKKI
jgi:peptidoglycan/LPS O-acetylase OafA/YrhL